MSHAFYSHDIAKIQYNDTWYETDPATRRFICVDAFEMIDFPSVSQPEDVGCKDWDQLAFNSKYADLYQRELSGMLPDGERPACIKFKDTEGYTHYVPLSKIQDVLTK